MTLLEPDHRLPVSRDQSPPDVPVPPAVTMCLAQRQVSPDADGVRKIAGSHDGTDYTVGILRDGIVLEVLSPGSPAGGSGSESHFGVTGEPFGVFLEKLGMGREGLPDYVASLRGGQWREFWCLVSEFATARFTWFDTDW